MTSLGAAEMTGPWPFHLCLLFSLSPVSSHLPGSGGVTSLAFLALGFSPDGQVSYVSIFLNWGVL